MSSFATAIALARAIRYFGIGYLAIRYGEQALPFIAQHKIQVAVGVIVFVAVSYGLSRIILRNQTESAAG